MAWPGGRSLIGYLVVLIDFRCHQLLVPALSMPCHHLLNTLVLAHTTSLYKLIDYNPGLLVYPAGSWKQEKDCDANATREGETVIPIATWRPTTSRPVCQLPYAMNDGAPTRC